MVYYWWVLILIILLLSILKLLIIFILFTAIANLMKIFVTKFYTWRLWNQRNQKILFGLSNRKKKMKIKNVLIDETKYKNWLIYFTRYDRENLIETLSVYYHRLVGNTEEHNTQRFCKNENFVPNVINERFSYYFLSNRILSKSKSSILVMLSK